MTFLFCKWLIAANIVPQHRGISDSEEEAAPQQATEATHEAMVSTRGKEAAESSRKGKEPVLPAVSEEEFDSEETETSEEAGETGSSSDERAGLPDSFFERGLTQASPRVELRTKYHHEGSEARPLKRQKKVVSKPRVHLPALEETSDRSASSDEQGNQEEGELPADAVSPGGMETEETSFVQQMQDALKE
ncbi:uncharacterized protein LOC109839659 [Asparagus officinalis]|uniref:uncharacterized protein LOC109839659 n=1 Tax=Asparagus officinalis TaxID=4686 RepID=UPI00098E394F|nr:uncharacterized protein LOC109839659 [Asparagus officinalis]